MIISVDPGDTTGVAVWHEDGRLVRKWKMTFEAFIDWADNVDFQVSKVVVEKYTSRPGQTLNKKGSKLKASQGVGVAKALARRHRAEVIEQPSDILRLAALHADIPVPARGHIADDVSAYLHGFYYLVSIGTLLPVLQQEAAAGKLAPT